MKKYVLVLMGLFFGIISHAQDNESKEKNLKDEFTYKKINRLNSSSGTLSIDGGEKKYLEPITNDIGTRSSSSGIGETMGELSVSLTGGASYNIPIATPPGINGVEPKVSLNYNSQGGNGLAGYGWNLQGISVISRVASTKYHDNVIDPVDFDNLDRFSIDGKRLVLKSGTYGGNGAEYETEIFSNLRIKSWGISPYGANFGPEHFTVEYPDGSIAYYGSNSNSRTRINYAITYWQNPQGLRINYEYFKTAPTNGDANEIRINKIKYGGRLSSIAINEIQFEYNRTRARFENSYINGVNFGTGKVLNKIKVFSNNTKYREYALTHNLSSLSYERLTEIQEISGDGSKSHSPIYFNYNDSYPQITYNENVMELGLLNIEQRNNEAVTLDFTGDGRLDFIIKPKNANEKDKFWIFKDLHNTGSNNNLYQVNTGGFYEEIFPTTWLTHNNKILAGQGLTVVQNNASNNDVFFKVYSESSTNPMSIQYQKLWSPPTYTYDNNCNSTSTYKMLQKYISGDFDGDGLTDIIAISKPYNTRSCQPIECGGGGGDEIQKQLSNKKNNSKITTNRAPGGSGGTDCCECNQTTYNLNSRVNFINLDRRVTSNFSKHAGYIPHGLKTTDKILVVDVNGDGKSDILQISAGKIYVYSLDNNNNLQLLWQTNDTSIKIDDIILIGDYNGDGKTDFMKSIADGSSSFSSYISTGNSFYKYTSSHPFTYKKTLINGGTGTVYGYNLLPIDTNGDGRTDIIEYNTTTYNNSSNGQQVVKIYNNYGTATSTKGNPKFIYRGSGFKQNNVEHFPIPIYLSSNKPNKSLEFASISNKWVTSFNFTQDHREDMLLRSVDNNGIEYTIDYKNLDSSETTEDDFQVYQKDYSQSYPYVDVQTSSGSKVVTTLKRIISNTPTIKQTFTYYGAIYNMEGLGFLGFKGLAQSN